MSIQGAVVVTSDGLALSSNLRIQLSEERVAAVSATIFDLGQKISSELSRGNIEQIYIAGKNGHSVLTSCSKDVILLVLADESAKQEALLREVKQISARIHSVISRQFAALTQA